MGGSGQQETAAQAVDVVDLYGETTADYVVVAFAKNSWIKIVRRETRDILFGGSLQPEGTTIRDYVGAMSKVLRAMGAPVKR